MPNYSCSTPNSPHDTPGGSKIQLYERLFTSGKCTLIVERRVMKHTLSILSVFTILCSYLSFENSAQAQTSAFGSGNGVVTVVPIDPNALRPGERNSLGWNTGYSAITTNSERPNVLGRSFGGSDTIHETTTRVVPNDMFGNPSRFGGLYDSERNSAGWNTGYTAVTSTYERSDPLGASLGGPKTVTETKTQILPNDALGQPIRPFGGLWP